MYADVNFVLVTRQTMLEDLIRKYNTVEQAEFYITHLGQDFEFYREEDQHYRIAKQMVQEILGCFGRVNVLDRNYLPNYIFGRDAIVVVLGQDGLVANTMKYLDGQVIVGVNPDAKRFDGVLLPFEPEDLKHIIPEVLAQSRSIKQITMAKASLNDGQELYAVNDLFIGPKSHTSARYSLMYRDIVEQQSSSGIIISTGLGSTGWLKSIIQGANAISGSLKGMLNDEGACVPVGSDVTEEIRFLNMGWESEKLIFSVREPFPSRSSQAKCVFGEIDMNNPLRILSNMPENGVIFSDGIESDFLSFSSGIEANIGIAHKKGALII